MCLCSWERAKTERECQENLAPFLSLSWPDLSLQLDRVRDSDSNTAHVKCTQAVRAMEAVNDGIDFSKIFGWQMDLQSKSYQAKVYGADGPCTVARMKAFTLKGTSMI